MIDHAPSISALIRVVAELRSEGGCPWDQAQDHRSLIPYLVEEAYEAVEALENGEATAEARELGDLLFQVVLHARIAEEEGRYDLERVAAEIVTKMIRRHPHVYGADAPVPASGALPGSNAFWEAQKARERSSRESLLDGIPRTLPALLRTHRAGEKLSRIGFDWPDMDGVWEKVDEERAELLQAIENDVQSDIVAEYGDLLMAVANLGRFLAVGPEEALRLANQRFERRFRSVEALASAAGVSLHEASLPILEGLWEQAKAQEKTAGQAGPAEPGPRPVRGE